MGRDEHLAFCKERALAYLNDGDLASAVTSMASDLDKHPETKPAEVLLQLGMLHLIQHDEPSIRRWIDGFR